MPWNEDEAQDDSQVSSCLWNWMWRLQPGCWGEETALIHLDHKWIPVCRGWRGRGAGGRWSWTACRQEWGKRTYSSFTFWFSLMKNEEVRNSYRHFYKRKFLEKSCAAECCIESQHHRIRNQFEKVCVQCTVLCAMVILHVYTRKRSFSTIVSYVYTVYFWPHQFYTITNNVAKKQW